MTSMETSSDDISVGNGEGQHETDRPVPMTDSDSHVLSKSMENAVFRFIGSREVAELIPVFDGHNIPVNSFIRCCRSAESLTPSSGHAYLLQLIRSRVRGNADAFLGNQSITDISTLLNNLKRAYAPTRSISQYQIDLSTVQQKDNEIVFDYGMRVNEILRKGLEAIDDVYPTNLAEGMATGMRDCAIKSFIRGLKNPLELRMNGKQVKNLNSAIDEAINIEHEVEQRKQLMNSNTEKKADTQHNENFKRFIPHARRYTIKHMSLKDITCYRCNRQGHMARNCRQEPTNMSRCGGEKRKYMPSPQEPYKRTFKGNDRGIKQNVSNQACQTTPDLNSRAGRL